MQVDAFLFRDASCTGIKCILYWHNEGETLTLVHDVVINRQRVVDNNNNSPSDNITPGLSREMLRSSQCYLVGVVVRGSYEWLESAAEDSRELRKETNLMREKREEKWKRSGARS